MQQTMNYNAEITSLSSLLFKGATRLSKEISSLLKIGLKNYLESQTEKYYLTNTFLHRFEKVRFDDIYFPISVLYHNYHTNFHKLSEVFDKYNFITVIGGAGSGKSTFVKYIFLTAIKQTHKIPILVELRHLNEYDGSLTDFISSKILNLKIEPNDTTLDRVLKKGDFLFLFDGYDEIFTKRKQQIANDIETFTDKYYKNNFIITTRPGSGIESVQRFFNFTVKELTNIEVYQFIDIMVVNEERNGQIKNIIEKTETKDYKEYLTNPLLLSMFILAFESHPEIPSKKSAFYRNVFDTLYSKHDGVTKGSFPREKKSLIKREDFEEILSAFAFLSLVEGKYSFTEEYLSKKLLVIHKKKPDLNFKIEELLFDLETSISIMVKDGFEFKFPHRSMQEYFASLFISQLPENKKNKAYEKIKSKLVKSSYDGSFNLWRLCKELDYSFYYEYIVLKELKNVSKLLHNERGVSLITIFLKYVWHASISMDRDLLEPNLFVPFIYRTVSLYNNIVEFEQIYLNSRLSFCLIQFQEEVSEILCFNPKDVYPNVAGKDYSKKLYEKNMIDFFFKIEMHKIIADFRKKTNNYIVKIEKKMKKEDNNLDDLLDF